jgi:hypothetical protein
MGKKAAILVTLCIMIIVVVFFEFYVFITPTQPNDPYSAQYYAEFNKPPTLSNYSFSPPVSMYHALLIALESGGWNATSLKNMSIYVELDDCIFIFPPYGTGFARYPLTHSVADWSPQQINGTTYQYAWTITVGYGEGATIYFVDVVTAELILTRILVFPAHP